MWERKPRTKRFSNYSIDDRWINTNRCLPEIGVPVLICEKMFSVRMGKISNYKISIGIRYENGFVYIDGFYARAPHFWMPLPKAPEEVMR